jgi:ATP-binding cassette subfamily B multidrug efflux pump
MFAFFERLLTPTAAPEQPQPPAGLVAFFWHYARQAKWLFVGLFSSRDFLWRCSTR